MWTRSGLLSSEQCCGIKAKSVCRNPIAIKIQRCVGVRASRSILAQRSRLDLLFYAITIPVSYGVCVWGGCGLPTCWGPSCTSLGLGPRGPHMTCDWQMASRFFYSRDKCRGITRIHRLPSRPSHPYGRQPHSLIFMSTLYKASSRLPASS